MGTVVQGRVRWGTPPYRGQRPPRRPRSCRVPPRGQRGQRALPARPRPCSAAARRVPALRPAGGLWMLPPGRSPGAGGRDGGSGAASVSPPRRRGELLARPAGFKTHPCSSRLRARPAGERGESIRVGKCQSYKIKLILKIQMLWYRPSTEKGTADPDGQGSAAAGAAPFLNRKGKKKKKMREGNKSGYVSIGKYIWWNHRRLHLLIGGDLSRFIWF